MFKFEYDFMKKKKQYIVFKFFFYSVNLEKQYNMFVFYSLGNFIMILCISLVR